MNSVANTSLPINMVGMSSKMYHTVVIKITPRADLKACLRTQFWLLQISVCECVEPMKTFSPSLQVNFVSNAEMKEWQDYIKFHSICVIFCCWSTFKIKFGEYKFMSISQLVCLSASFWYNALLDKYHRLAWTPQSSYLNLPNAGTTVMQHHTWVTVVYNYWQVFELSLVICALWRVKSFLFFLNYYLLKHFIAYVFSRIVLHLLIGYTYCYLIFLVLLHC